MMGPGIAAVFALAGCEATIVSRSSENAARGIAKGARHHRPTRRQRARRANSGDGREGAACREGRTRRRRRRPPSCSWSRSPSTWATKQEYFARLDAAAPDTLALLQHLPGISITGDRRQVPQARTGHDHPFGTRRNLMPWSSRDGQRTDLAAAQNRRRPLAGCRQSRGARTEGPARENSETGYQQALIRECISIVRGRDPSAEDVDMAIKAGMGLRFPVYGVFEHADLVGARSREGRPGLRPTRLTDHQIRGPLLEQKVRRASWREGGKVPDLDPREGRSGATAARSNSSCSSCGGKRRGKSGAPVEEFAN